MHQATCGRCGSKAEAPYPDAPAGWRRVMAAEICPACDGRRAECAACGGTKLARGSEVRMLMCDACSAEPGYIRRYLAGK
ncbi:MAG TPA: hypothetical protein VMT39_02370 [Candidatus Bathyarchaeia archaeon]|nr:hypothetical protein [Candidatus Bathyarchaeia archaeon]